MLFRSAQSAAARLSQIEPDAPHAGVLFGSVVLEAQMGHQAEHGAIRRQYQPIYIGQALLLSRIDQAAHQLRAKTAPLPGVANDQSVFGTPAVGIPQIMRKTDDMLDRKSVG